MPKIQQPKNKQPNSKTGKGLKQVISIKKAYKCPISTSKDANQSE